MRQIVLDTETTGIDISAGNRLIEIGCVELINRKITGNYYHQYINPEREVEEGAFRVHGIDSNFLADKPRFHEIAEDFLAFVKGAQLIIHNAPFDIGFLDHELKLMDKKQPLMQSYCPVIDTLVMAKEKHPGQRNSLDALCKRYGVDNTGRDLHGALLDSELLADVYLLMTGGQTGLALESSDDDKTTGQTAGLGSIELAKDLVVVKGSDKDLASHEEYLNFLQKESDGHCCWLNSTE